MTRTAPIPMYLLSQLVRDHTLKVVLSGEGADELLAGYPVFQKRQPTVIAKFYRSKTALRLLRGYNRHLIAVEKTLKGFMNNSINTDVLDAAQRTEAATKLSRYLLSTQGDRMALAHGVEVRYPFLDEDFVAFVSSIPEVANMSGGKGKVLLREAMSGELPPPLLNRVKKGYLAPDSVLIRAFRKHHEFLLELLSPKNIRTTDMYEERSVGDILSIVKRAPDVSTLDESIIVAFTFLVTMQLFHRLFIENQKEALSLITSVTGR